MDWGIRNARGAAHRAFVRRIRKPTVSGAANVSEAVIRVEFRGDRADAEYRVVYGGDGPNPESLTALIDEVNRYLAARER